VITGLGRILAGAGSVSRPLRIHAPATLHHLFARGDNKARIFADDEDCERFLDLLATTSKRFDVHCVAYCLLSNHYHLVLVPHKYPISRLMQQLNSAYCQGFNRRHGRVGHVLQGRFGCKIVEDGGYARTVLRYVALNPVAAGLAAAPHEYRWSSYPSTIGSAPVPGTPPLALEHVWSAFETSEPEVGRARFAELVRAELQEPPTDALLFGSTRLAERFAPALQPHRSNPEFSYAHRFSARLPLDALLQGCANRQRLEEAAHVAFCEHGYTLAELGRALNRDASTVCRWIRRAESRRIGAPDAAGRPARTPEGTRNKI
jgi:REP element-mobilizing transposase RayT